MYVPPALRVDRATCHAFVAARGVGLVSAQDGHPDHIAVTSALALQTSAGAGILSATMRVMRPQAFIAIEDNEALSTLHEGIAP